MLFYCSLISRRFVSTHLGKRHRAASSLPHLGLHRLTQHPLSKSEAPFWEPVQRKECLISYNHVTNTALAVHISTVEISSLILCFFSDAVNSSSFLTCLHFSVVMSSWSVTTLGMGLMGTKSTPEKKKPLLRGSTVTHITAALEA